MGYGDTEECRMDNRYNRLLDREHFDPQRSQEKILAQIKPGSKVLECGCATGYMTCYMRDKLQCSVSIVEYDESAFQKARQYASDGICADLMESEWVDFFEGQKFDYILFADVLEHLCDPQAVLRKAATLLSEDGYLLASIPNVAHGDILINLWDGNWNYTEIGLLDKTHVHFFAGNNLKAFFAEAALTMIRLDYTFVEIGQTEQAERVLPSIAVELINALERKYDSRIYQFIVTAQHSKFVQENHISFTSERPSDCGKRAQLFFEKNGTFSAEDTVIIPYILDDFQHRFDLKHNRRGNVRFDPIDGRCVVFSIHVSSSVGELEILPINGYRAGQIDIFTTNDPQYEIYTEGRNIEWIEIRAKIVSAERIGWLQFVMGELIQETETAQEYLKKKELELQQGKSELDCIRERLFQAEKENGLTSERLTQTEQENALLSERLMQAKEENVLTNERLSQAEAKAAQTQIELNRSEAEKTRLQQILAEREQLLDGIQNSFSFKITRPLYNLKTALYFAMEKYPFTKRLRKAISVLRRQGLCELIRQYREYRENKKRLNEYRGEEPATDETSAPIYDAQYQVNRAFTDCTADVKALAFYLPQFHTFPENDMWWGTGFTEWTNVKKGTPRFQDHYQPRTPHEDIGYYCLEDINVMRQQAELAKSHGIYGFCFYYYWFSGKRLMEKPVDLLLLHPEIDIPFCLCWANENWTRRWDGQEQDVLIKQEYSEADDEVFIADLKKYLDDPRYIRVHGKPIIVVYSPCFIPDCRKSFQKWREVAKKIGVGEIEIWICLTWGRTSEIMQIVDCVDAEVEFPPHNLGGQWLEIPNIERAGKETIIYDYTRLVDFITDVWERMDADRPLPIHYSCMMAWDNAARRKDGWHAFYHFSLKSFYRWLSEAVRQAKARLPEEERFIFINAWNEWGEGTYLEPDEKYGYANINTAAKAIFGIPFELDTVVVDKTFPIAEKNMFQHKKGGFRIAVQAHIFHVDLLESIAEQLNHIPYAFDLFVTTDSKEKKKAIGRILKRLHTCRKVSIQVLPNRGRDVAPFIVQMAPEIDGYDYIGHIHTKRTINTHYGDSWREYLFHNLLGSSEYVERLFGLFEGDKELGLIMPEFYPPIREQTKWTGEYAGVRSLLDQIQYQGALPLEMAFPAGNMFWARTAAVRPLFALGLKQSDFPEEAGQRYGTLAHQIERAWVYVAEKAGYRYCAVLNSCSASVQKKRRADMGRSSSESTCT